MQVMSPCDSTFTPDLEASPPGDLSLQGTRKIFTHTERIVKIGKRIDSRTTSVIEVAIEVETFCSIFWISLDFFRFFFCLLDQSGG